MAELIDENEYMVTFEDGRVRKCTYYTGGLSVWTWTEGRYNTRIIRKVFDTDRWEPYHDEEETPTSKN